MDTVGIRAALALLSVLTACERTKATPSATPAEGVALSPKNAAPAPAPPSGSPRSQRELPTTDGALAVENLQAQIAGYERQLAAHPRGPAPLKALIGLYSMRAQFLGQLADYDRALALADRLVRATPRDPAAYLARASCRTSFHLFPQALADLGEAENLGARPDELVTARAPIDQALGHYDEALAIRQKTADEWQHISTLGALATIYAERGDTAEAERLFIAAQDHFGDVSPFALAWLYFQEGLLWQKAGMLARARDLFAAAHERLPAYAPAAGHLAEVLAMTGEREQAKNLLTPLLAATDDPEYPGQLAALEAEGGDAARAAELKTRAAKRFDELTRRHPEAFADHAARFWLRAGDAAKASVLADKNLAVRVTRDSCLLAIQAALAAKQPARACVAADRGLALERPGATLELAATRAFQACGRPLRAEAMRRATRARSPKNP